MLHKFPLAILLILFVASGCNNSGTRHNFSNIGIEIPDALNNGSNLAVFLKISGQKLAEQIKITEKSLQTYIALANKKETKEELFLRVKLFTVHTRMKAEVKQLSHIFSAIEKESADISTQLNTQQSEMFSQFMDSLRSRYDDIFLKYKLVEFKYENKIVFY